MRRITHLPLLVFATAALAALFILFALGSPAPAHAGLDWLGDTPGGSGRTWASILLFGALGVVGLARWIVSRRA